VMSPVAAAAAPEVFAALHGTAHSWKQMAAEYRAWVKMDRAMHKVDLSTVAGGESCGSDAGSGEWARADADDDLPECTCR